MLHTKFQPNIPTGFEEKADFITFSVLSYYSHLEF